MKTRRYEPPAAPAPQATPDSTPSAATVRQVAVDEKGIGQRLDNFLGRILAGVPKTHIFRVIRKGEVRVNGKRARPESRLQAGDMVRVPPIRTGAAAPPRRVPDSLVAGITAAIVREDAQLLVIDKPAGVAVHGGSGVSGGRERIAAQAKRQLQRATQPTRLFNQQDIQVCRVKLQASPPGAATRTSRQRRPAKLVWRELACR